jgi:hypothetical protein
LLVSGPADVTGWADYLVVTQKPTPAMLAAIEGSGLPVLDVAGVLAKAVLRETASV